MKPIRKLLVANRSEIAIRVFRTAHELGIRTVAIYSHEDRYALHRFKADEAYQIGRARRADSSRIWTCAKPSSNLAQAATSRRDSSRLWFLSENPEFAQACQEAGITFVGPQLEIAGAAGRQGTSARDCGNGGRAGARRQR